MYLLSASFCKAAEDRRFHNALQGARRALEQRSLQEGRRLRVVGVALDSVASDGVKFLASLGEFDEIHAGGGWLNDIGVERIWRDPYGLPIIPQIIVVPGPFGSIRGASKLDRIASSRACTERTLRFWLHACLLPIAIQVACGPEATHAGVAPNVPTDYPSSTSPASNIRGVVSSTPFLDLASDPDGQFHQVRSITKVCGERILVADQGSSSLHLYTSDGTERVRLGGLGAGPGEFQLLQGAWSLPGDSIIAWDGILNRATLFSCHDGGVRVVDLQNVAVSLGIGVVGDRTLVVAVPPPLAIPEPGVLRIDTLKLPGFISTMEAGHRVRRFHSLRS